MPRGAGAAPLVQLLPQVRAALPEMRDTRPLGPEHERLRLCHALAQFLTP